MTINTVNQKEIPKKYYHCFKLSDSKYVLFDIKIDIPLIVGSLGVIKSFQLPENSLVFYYKLNQKGFFEKFPEKYIEIVGINEHTKPPLRFHVMDKDQLFYHHFKVSNVLSSLYDTTFKMPVMYGSNQKIQAILNNIPTSATIFYYKEDASFKKSFKLFMTYSGKKIKT